MPPRVIREKIPRHENVQPESMDQLTCPKTGHVVPLPPDHSPNGHYTLFDAKGKTLHKGSIADLITPVADAETADSTTDSEDTV